jgi:AcrR family transcriptional regulator
MAANRGAQKSGGTGKSFWHFLECARCSRPSEETRQALLSAAFEEIHRFGFQSASISRILKHTGVTKGALYHYFPSKKALGYAVLDEIIRDSMRELWIEPLQQGHPIDAIINTINEAGRQMTLDDIRLGCPLSNLSQEMSPVDEGFRERVETLYGEWRGGISTALQRGQASGEVRQDVDTDAMAVMVVATLEGCLAAAKNAQSHELLMQCGCALIQILENLRTQGNKK